MPDYSVKRLTQPAYDALKELATTQPEMWLDPNTDFGALLVEKGIPDYTEDTDAIGDADFVLEPALDEPSNRRHRSDKQALAYYDSLLGITPSVATDGNMWTWMNHFRLHSYSIHRWAGGFHCKSNTICSFTLVCRRPARCTCSKQCCWKNLVACPCRQNRGEEF